MAQQTNTSASTSTKYEKPLIVITGASSGIGEECARFFSKEGHPLLLLARRVDKMEKNLGGLKNVLIEKVDVTNYEQMKSALDKAEKRFGPCDCLINNAGVMLLGRVEDQKIEEWDTMMQVNVYGVLNGIKCVLKGMKERKNGTIINISSMAGVKNYENHAVYCGTKFAVNAISEGLRAEVALSGVKVTTICPGVVETELLAHNKEKEDIYGGYVDWKKSLVDGALLPEDIASACLYVYKLPRRACIRELQITPTNQIP